MNLQGDNKKRAWSRLDNAAKIFPPSNMGTNTCVFRFSCELTEEIDPALLQQAVDKAVLKFPAYLVIMKSGAFWYYFEQTDLRPQVVPESRTVCGSLYENGSRNLLFEVSYYKTRINLEMFHALTDGTGAVSFLKTIVYHYLLLAHPDDFGDTPPVLPDDGSEAGRQSDSFRKYYKKVHTRRKKKNEPRAFNVKAEHSDRDGLQIIEGVAPVHAVLDAAHSFGTTMTVFLTAVFIEALRSEMPTSAVRRPVVLGVPVNLRTYFPSDTARNFFGMIDVSYNFGKRNGKFGDIVSEVDKGFKEELTREKLEIRMNNLAALEHNLAVQLAPLPLKNFVLRIAKLLSDRAETAVISNVGRAVMPKEMMRYIRLFSAFASTLKLQLTLVSCGDTLSLGFTSAFASTEIQKNFFRRLTEAGIPVEIRCNEYYAEPEENGSSAAPSVTKDAPEKSRKGDASHAAM